MNIYTKILMAIAFGILIIIILSVIAEDDESDYISELQNVKIEDKLES